MYKYNRHFYFTHFVKSYIIYYVTYINTYRHFGTATDVKIIAF